MISRAVDWILGCFLLAPAFGQGLIDLNNRGMAQVFDATGKPLTGTRFVAQIWYGSSANSLSKSFAPAPFRSSTPPLARDLEPCCRGRSGHLRRLRRIRSGEHRDASGCCLGFLGGGPWSGSSTRRFARNGAFGVIHLHDSGRPARDSRRDGKPAVILPRVCDQDAHQPQQPGLDAGFRRRRQAAHGHRFCCSTMVWPVAGLVDQLVCSGPVPGFHHDASWDLEPVGGRWAGKCRDDGRIWPGQHGDTSGGCVGFLNCGHRSRSGARPVAWNGVVGAVHLNDPPRPGGRARWSGKHAVVLPRVSNSRSGTDSLHRHC